MEKRLLHTDNFVVFEKKVDFIMLRPEFVLREKGWRIVGAISLVFWYRVVRRSHSNSLQKSPPPPSPFPPLRFPKLKTILTL